MPCRIMPLPIDRRSLLSSLAALPLFPGCAALGVGAAPRRPGIAITIDDFDLSDTALMSGEERDAAIRKSLARHGVKAAGFVAGKYADRERSARVLAAWSRDGHIIGNHSFSHSYYDGHDPAGTMADILRCEALLARYDGFQKLFRFPYLAEGRTREGRDALRTLLRAQGYRNGHVTIDTSDWFIDGRLRKRLDADAQADIAPYRTFYLAHIWDRASHYDGLAQAVFGHSINHTILLHHRLATGLFLNDLLAMFRARGWRLIDASTAFASPEFAQEFDVLPAGQSLVWAAAKATGRFEGSLRYPAEDGKYEASKMDAAGL